MTSRRAPHGQAADRGASSRHALARLDGTGYELRPSPSRRRLALRALVRYEPKPLAPPRVDEQYEQLSLPARFGETIRYNVACLEYAIAPGGHLRAYLWLNLRLLCFFLVPATVVLVVLAVVTPIFGSLARILGFAATGARSLFMAVLWLVLMLLTLAAVAALAIALVAAKRRRHG